MQVEKTALHCAVFFLDHYDVAKYSVTFCNRAAVSGQNFQNTPRPAVPYL